MEVNTWTEGSKITMWLKNSQDIIILTYLEKNPTMHTTQCTNYNFNELFSFEMMEIPSKAKDYLRKTPIPDMSSFHL